MDADERTERDFLLQTELQIHCQGAAGAGHGKAEGCGGRGRQMAATGAAKALVMRHKVVATWSSAVWGAVC